jgi:hypothetical protein
MQKSATPGLLIQCSGLDGNETAVQHLAIRVPQEDSRVGGDALDVQPTRMHSPTQLFALL